MRIRQAVLLVATMLAVGVLAPSANAFTTGTGPQLLFRTTVNGAAVAAGNTLMLHDGTTNFALIPGGSEANIDDLDPDATIVKAVLFWSGSSTVLGADTDVDFTLPNGGGTFNDLSINTLLPGEPASMLSQCAEQNINGTDFFSCRREVTFLLQNLGVGMAEGNYRVDDLNARPGDCVNDPFTCQAMFGGWALVVMWESPTHPVVRDLVLHDAFFAADETNAPFTSGISLPFLLDNFTVGTDAQVEFTFMGFEGDAQLGNPPQDNIAIGPGLYCPSCPDFIELSASGTARLSDPVNPEGNVFNGSDNGGGGPHPGIDIDTFDLGPDGLGVLDTGDTSMTLVVGSGDGIAGNGDPGTPPPDPGGSGELVMLGFTLLSLDTLAPRFDNADTVKTVLQSEAAPGDTLNYILRVENNGSAPALNSRIRDNLPTGVTYAAGTTTNTCGVNSSDVAGTSPVLTASGLTIGTLNTGQECEVRFDVTLDAGVADDTVLSNFGEVEASNHGVFTFGPANTTVKAPQLGTPEKRVQVAGGGSAVPGATLLYTIRVNNTGDVDANLVEVDDTLPASLENVTLISLPPGTVGIVVGNNVSVSNMTVPASGFAEVVISADIGAAVAAGTLIENQADVNSPQLPIALLTDDPDQPGGTDPTRIAVESSVNISTSFKSGIDVDGPLLLPGDTIEYTIRVTQTGDAPLTVAVGDDLPVGVENCTITSVPAASFANCAPGGANGTGRIDGTVSVLGGQSVDLVFTATVRPDAPDGLVIVNTASLTPLQDPGQLTIVQSGPLEVFARPVFTTSFKTVTDLNGGDARPGDILRYSVIVENSGPVAAANVVVTDDVDPNLNVTAIDNGGTFAAGTVTWTVPALATGANVTLSFDAEILAGTADGTIVRNDATADADNPAEPFTTPEVTIEVQADPDIEVEKIVVDLNGAPFEPGDTVRYAIRIINSGDGAANNVEVRDLVDGALNNVTFPGGGNVVGGEAVFTSVSNPGLGSIGPGSDVTVEFDAVILNPLANGTIVSNQAFVTVSNAPGLIPSDDPATGTVDDPTNFAVTSQATLVFEKVALDLDGAPLLPGDNVEFTLTVQNTGNAPATDVALTDPLDARLTFLNSVDGGLLIGSEVRFNAGTTPALGAVVPGTPVSVRFVAQVDAPLANGTIILNQATAQSPVAPGVLSDDPTTPAPLDPVTLVVESRPVLEAFEKSVVDVDGDGIFAPGDTIRYTLSVTNTGTEPSTTLVVTDVLPAELTNIVPPPGATLAGNTLTFNQATLNIDETLTLVIDADIVRPLGNGVLVQNQASLASAEQPTELSDDPATAADNDPTLFTVTSQPALLVEKVVFDDNGVPPEPGDTLRYEITLTNTGDRAADDITVTDPVSASLTAIAPGQGGQVAGATVTWNAVTTPALASLNVDQSVTLTFTADIVVPTANGTLIENQASAALAEPGIPGAPFVSDDPATPAPLDATVVQVVSGPNLSGATLESTDGGGGAIEVVNPGDTVTYVLNLVNSGNANGDAVVITVDIPASLTNVNAVDGQLVGTTLRFDENTLPVLGDLPIGAPLTITFTADVVSPQANGTAIALQGNISATDVVAPFVTDDPSTALAQDPTVVTVASASDLSTMTKTFVDINGAPAEPGDVIQYVINVTNTGDANADNVQVGDPLAAELEFVASSTGGVFQGGAVVFTPQTTPGLASVAPGVAGAVELRFEVRIAAGTAAGTIVQNQAFAVADDLGPTPTDDPATPAPDDSTDFEVETVPALDVEKALVTSSGSNIVAPGDTLTYTITVRSTGTGTVPASTLTDPLPAGIVNVVPGPGLTLAAGTLSANVPALAPSEEAVFSFTALVADDAANGLRIENQADVAAPGLGIVRSDDPSTPDVDDATVALVEAFPDLNGTTKTVLDENGGAVAPGDVLRYDITIQNGGNGQAREVEVTDVLDAANLEVVEVLNGGAQAGTTILWTSPATVELEEIPAGESVTVSVRVRVLPGTEDGTDIDNQGSVTARDLPAPVLTDDPSTPAADDATRVTVAAPVLTFSKVFNDLTAPNNELRPGDAVRYDLVIQNGGSVPATNVVITDLLPERLVDVTVAGGTLNGQEASWNIPEVPANQATTLTISATIDPLAVDGEVIRNQATLSADELALDIVSDNPSTPAEGDPTDATVVAVESYTGTITLFDAEDGTPIVAPVMPGQRIRVDVNVINDGSQAGQAVVVRIPFVSSFFRLEESADGIVNPEGTEMRWTASTTPALLVLLPGEQVQLSAIGSIQPVITDGAEIPVSAFVTSALALGVMEWEIGPAIMIVDSAPDLSTSTKSVRDENGGLVEPGDLLEYTIEVVNRGGARADNVVVLDPAPAGTVYVGGTTTVGGLPIGDNGGTSELSAGLQLGNLDAQRSVEVQFTVRVDVATLRGFEVKNQAILKADGVPDAVTDNPATPLIVGDATSVIVGGGPLLVATKIGAPSPVAQGGVLHFTIAVENAGTDFADDVFINDPLGGNGVFLPGSIRIDGQPATEANDGDPAAFFTGPTRLEVRRARLEAGEGMLVEFDVTAEAGPQVLNQAEVSAVSIPVMFTDARPDVTGDQPTVVPVAGTRAILIDGASTTLKDQNGGVLVAGDPLALTTSLLNHSAETVRVTDVLFNVSARVVVDVAALEEGGFVFNEQTRVVRPAPGTPLPEVESGQAFTWQVNAGLSVDADAPLGEEVAVLAEAAATTLDGALTSEGSLGRSALTIGLMDGAGAITGRLFFEGEERDNVFNTDTDEPARDFQVLAFRVGRDDSPVRTAISNDAGAFQLLPLPAGDYRLEVRTQNGTTFKVFNIAGLTDGEVRDQDLRIDPSGVLYRSSTFAPVRGTRVFLYVDDGDEDLENDVLVDPEALLEGQQGQITTRQGLYRFDPFPGEYRIGVEPPSILFSFPSTVFAPERSDGEVHPLGDVAEPAPDGRIVPQGVPSSGGATTHYLRFSLSDDAPPVLNNHIPMDSLRDSLRITKTANKKKLSIGDMVAYTVRVDNPSGAAIAIGGDGGVELADTLPAGFRLVDDAWLLQRIEIDNRGQTRRLNERPVLQKTARQLVFGPFELRANTSYELRYHVVVGPGTPLGTAENRALMRLSDGEVPVTDTARARVRVIPDPIFDLGTLRAKVFCDANGDGWQDEGDLGVGGARVYLDNGHYADADITGKLHFTGLIPGMHLAKVDTDTLPPGSVMVKDERENFYISAGLPAKVSFPVRCVYDRIESPTVTLNEDAYRVDIPPPPMRDVNISGSIVSRQLSIDGVEVPLGRLDLGVGTEKGDVSFGRAAGPNVALSESGTLDERFRFAPRVDIPRKVHAWRLTVQRERLVDGPASPAQDPADNATVDGGLTDAAETSEVDAGAANASADAGPTDNDDAGTVLALSERDGSTSDAGVTDAAIRAEVDAGSDSATVQGPQKHWESEPVYVFAGEGAPPSKILWAGTDEEQKSVIVAGERFSAVLAVTLEGGDELYSTARPFGVQWGEPSQQAPEGASGFETSVDEQKGALFTKKDTPRRKLKAWVKALIPQLQATNDSGGGKVEVLVHTDAQPKVATEALTARRANAVKAMLVDAGVDAERIVATGQGDKLPVVPNLRARDRKKNRRVEVRVLVEETVYPAIPPLSWPARVVFDQETLTLDDGAQAFDATRSLQIGTAFVVDVRTASGGRTRVVRPVLEEPGTSLSFEQVTQAGEPQLIVGDLADGRIEHDGKTYTLERRQAALEPVDFDAEGAPAIALDDSSATFTLLPSVNGDADIASWQVRLLTPVAVTDAPQPETTAPSSSDAGTVVTSGANSDAGGAPAPDAGAAPLSEPPVTPNAAPTLRARVVKVLSGDGAPPEEIVWDGQDSDGTYIADVGKVVIARLIVNYAAGDVTVAPDVIASGVLRKDVVPKEALVAAIVDPATASGRLKNRPRRAIFKLKAVLEATQAPIRIIAHTDNAGDETGQRVRSERTAREAKEVLVKAGIADARIEVVGAGATMPLSPNLNARTRKQNRRVEIRLGKQDEPVADLPVRVLANGEQLLTDGTSFSGVFPPASSGEVTLMMRTSKGARYMLRLRDDDRAVWRGTPAEVDAQIDEMLTEALAIQAASIDEAQAETAENPTAVVALAPTQAGAVVSAEAAADAGPMSGDAGSPMTETDAGEVTYEDAGPGRTRIAFESPPLVGDVASADGGPVDAEKVAYTQGGPAPFWWPNKADVPASRLTVDLPKDGLPMKSSKLVLRGQTDPQNTLRIQGQVVELDEEGRFEHLVDLTEGNSSLVVEAEDAMGNKGRIERLIEVDTSGWFALVMLEGAAGQDGARLDERGQYTSYTFRDYFVYGRGAAYVKGKFSGPYVFKDYDLTLHIDTRRWADEAFVRDVFEPDLLYPVYGDSSVEIQDAQAQYPLYLKFKADDSEMYVGNLRTTLETGDLTRFNRTRYGAQLKFDRGWSDGLGIDREEEVARTAVDKDPWRTQVKAFGTTGNANTRHARLELMGTGGSIYFMRHEDLVEGSERVAVIIRDAVTGAELGRAPLQRNLDYTVRYSEGRIILKEPIPAFADFAFVTNHNLGQVRAGHRVFLEVEYDHDTLEAFQGWAAGGQVKQLLFGHAELSAGYVYEARADGSPAYQLGGFAARLFLDEGTFVKGEFAYSQSVDAGNFVSYDGGLSYRNLGQRLDDDPVQRNNEIFPTERRGWAAKVEGQYQFGELFNQKASDALVRAHFMRQSPGFFAGANIVEQGQWKWGSELRWRMFGDGLLQLRYDGVVSEIPEIPHVTQSRILHRQLATLSYDHVLFKVLKIGAEYGGGLTWDSQSYDGTGQPRWYLTNVVAAKGEWQVYKDLTLGLRQEVILSGDGQVIFLGGDGSSQQLDSWNDHLITHATARYNLTDRLQITGTESLRWNGENQTQVGFSWKVDDEARVYANERLGMTKNGFSSTTVIGGEKELTSGAKTYAEYQLQSGFAGQQSRGVVGMKNRFKLPFGFALNFGYERTQVLGGSVTAQSTGAPQPGAFTDGTFFAAPGANGGGDYLYGAGSRDALSGGVEYARGGVRASQRFELRYDNFDNSRGGHDRLMFLSMSNVQWTVTPSVSLLARYNIALAQDLTIGRREAHLEEGMLGAAYRPVSHDWVSVWAKLSRRVEVRPLSLKEGRSEEYSVHAGTLEPIFELPLKLQLVEKLAIKHTSSLLPDLPRADAFTALWINRVNWHALGTVRAFGIDPLIPGDIDLGLEYRVLYGLTAKTIEHGTLVELQYAPLPFFRLGIGWNFTRFSDNELERNDTDHSGFFVRAVGQY